MICDIHVHLAGIGTGNSGNFVAPGFLRKIGLSPEITAAPDCDENIARAVVAKIEASQVTQAVLLAFDAAYRENGSRDNERTVLVVDNDFVARAAKTSAKTFFGASVHPYRRDALDELERVIDGGARLIKWIPSAQNIQPDHPRCLPFYDLLARHHVPLLCHTGVEHTLRGFSDDLNAPRRLRLALERGVTVIAAHCGARLFLHEKSVLPRMEGDGVAP